MRVVAHLVEARGEGHSSLGLGDGVATAEELTVEKLMHCKVDKKGLLNALRQLYVANRQLYTA